MSAAFIKEIYLWEHEHAYQPRRILNAFTNAEINKPIRKRVKWRIVEGKNLCHVMFVKGSVYEEIIKSLEKRSIDIEPITLELLKYYNIELYYELKKKVVNNEACIVATAYSHPILPLFYEERQGPLNVYINLYWSLMYYFNEFFKEIYNNSHRVCVGFWLPECAYTKEVIKILVKVFEDVLKIHQIPKEKATLYIILDESQGGGIIPDKPYLLEDLNIYVIFRDHALSDAISFSNDVDDIINAFEYVLTKYSSRSYVGIAADAECYGGNYYSCKPSVLDLVKCLLSEGILDKDRNFCKIKFIKINDVIDEFINNNKKVPHVKVYDYTSWSDYFFVLNPSQTQLTEGIVAGRVGGLMRWSGVERHNDRELKKTYFIIVTEIDEHGRKRVRVINSIWKVAFNKIREEISYFTTQKVLKVLDEITGNREYSTYVLKEYWKVALNKTKKEDYISELHKKGIIKEKINYDTFINLLEAYRLAVQDSHISCPTFWPMITNELSWTSLALMATGLIRLARALHDLEGNYVEVYEVYKIFLLDIDSNYWYNFIKEYDFQFEKLMDFLIKCAYQMGFNFKGEIRKSNSIEKLAKKLYMKAFSKFNLVVHPKDINVSAIEYVINNDKQSLLKAKIYEWKKSMNPDYKSDPLPTRVAKMHLKYFPSINNCKM